MEQNVQEDISTTAISPRLLYMHLPYQTLPESVKTSSSGTSTCRVVYLCRNLGDHFISSWKFFNKLRSQDLGPLPLEEAFDIFCNGVLLFGPYWEHVLGYWKASEEGPDDQKTKKILFLRYEELQRDPRLHLKRMAYFLGCPFTIEEEGVIEKIADVCSFQRLSSLEVNKVGCSPFGFPNSVYFERGVVGASVEFLTPEMRERLRRITDEKLQGSDLNLYI